MYKRILITVLVAATCLTLIRPAQAVECTANISGKSQDELQAIIDACNSKVNDLKQQENTLSKQIQFMDSQIDLTTIKMQDTATKIESTQKEIELLGQRIEGLDSSLDYLSKLLLKRSVENYKRQNVSLLDELLDSTNANDLIARFKYYKTVQDNNQKLVLQVQETKSNFQEQVSLREKKKVQLDQLNSLLKQQQVDLDAQKGQKQKLLVDTGNDEETYQRLLSQAKAQLAAFGRFVTSQGGASLLSGQTVCDDWGCYYNQRDSQWGGASLNGTGYTIASDGCLVTSVAMVFTHLGHRGVTPLSINSNPNNFASYYPAYLLYTVSADGMTVSRVGATIDSTLSSGNPVIVGVHAYGGTHFVVLVSGSGGSYTMNDPYVAGGHRIPFTDHYSMGSIFEIDKVVPQ